jgi:hypothetical protein
MQIFSDSTMKRRSLDSKIQALTVKEIMSKDHMQVHTNKESRKKQPGRNRGRIGPKWARASQPGPTGAAHSGHGLVPPLTLPPLRLFIAPRLRATKKYIRHPPPRSREERDTVPERRGSRWLTRVPLAGVGTLHGRPRRSSRS